ncbi:putative peptidoglycan lipid II flippase [Caminicella sporogenes DSM 14501]|uniref:Probable lipid II flippase MurJ n=1 Tax=Caminicella sporogenes DSM 14501 TaxID=1121266 RepID=A0A1M6QGV1_9FIRM|nr:murein biosynthesis integral membrane protein MurJ [Caminicella sporogenes]RKD25323.1 murein biosynthesis integral membrane protein MurJ [Caminicella sporogenes]SHK19267.1 putative peptidoglycan lipid II flippase [Caminicella sporogenes DSM 14501]
MVKRQSTINTVILVIGLTIISKLFGSIREILIGSRFGTTLEADSYYLAYKVTALVFMSIGSAITATMIPIIVKYISKGDKERAYQFANKIFTILIGIALLLITFGILLSPYYTRYIAIGFEGYKYNLTVSLIKIMFPILGCIFITYVFVSILQSFGKFSITSILSIPFNIIIICYLIFFSSKYGIKGLAVATLIGWIMQFLIQVPYLLKKGFKLKIIFDFNDEDVKSFFKLILPTLLATTVYTVNILVDSSLASTLSDGKVAALNYAYMIYSSIATTTIYGISTVLFPKFAQSSSLQSYDKFKREINSTIKVLFFILIPMAAGLIVLSRPIVEIAFRRGAFDERAVILTKTALIYYSIGMIGFGLQEIFNKSFFALKDTKTPMKFGMISVGINIVLNIILVRIMDLGGLALATSIATVSNGIMLYISLMKKVGKFDNKDIIKQIFKVLISVLIMSLMVSFSYNILIFRLNGTSILINKGISLITSVFVGIFTYILMTIFLRINETKYLIDNYVMIFLKKDKR